nr:MAG TPA: hypothetical protein [Caudoviricetes sp.]
MKKPKVNLNWPVVMSDFTATDDGDNNPNEVFSRGKLKVFYKGETADHRYFSDAFAEKLLKSLPYTPIVSYYDEKAKDFRGHAPEQAIYGIVDPCKQPHFETEDDGKQWCVCDVVIYTERAGKIGEIAKQIVGHKQSLERTDAKYVINYDAHRHFKNIEFTDGKFVGVSVLGNDQEPAFTGSQFFTAEAQETLEQKLKLLRDYCSQAAHENLDQKEKTSNGGFSMQITNYSEFRKLTWGETATKLDETLTKEYGNEAYTAIEDRDAEFVYVKFYSYLDGSVSLYRIQYSLADDGSVQLGDRKQVHRTWEVIPEKAETTPAAATAEEAPVDEVVSSVAEEPQDGKDTVAVENHENQENNETEAETNSVIVNNEVAVDKVEDVAVPTEEVAEVEKTAEAADVPAAVVDAPATREVSPAINQATLQTVGTNEEENAEGEQSSEQQNNDHSASASTLDQSEREEFEALKKQEKLNFLTSYKDKLSDEDFQRFAAELDNYSSKESLEVEILRAALAHSQEEKSPIRRAAFYSCAADHNALKKEDSDEDWIKRALRR